HAARFRPTIRKTLNEARNSLLAGNFAGNFGKNALLGRLWVEIFDVFSALCVANSLLGRAGNFCRSAGNFPRRSIAGFASSIRLVVRAATACPTVTAAS